MARGSVLEDGVLEGEIIRPGEQSREVDVDAELARLERLANLLDSAFEIPGTNVRIGLDPIVGLVPGAGDLIMTLASLYIYQRLSRLGISRVTRARMMTNILADLIIGAVPVLGDFFDIAFRANVKNLELAKRALGR